MIDWNKLLVRRLIELIEEKEKHSEHEMAEILSNEYGIFISRNAVHNKIRRVNLRDFTEKKKLIKGDKKQHMKAPIPQMTKDEILKLHRWRCPHGHTGLVHYNCWCREQQHEEKVCFLDLETTNLKADFGIILAWSIKPKGENNIISGCITKDDLQSGILDKRIAKDCVDELVKYNRIITHYGSKFDILYLRSRCLWWGIDFPHYGELVQTDVWRIAREVLCIHSNRQDSIAEFLFRKTEKTRMNPTSWIMALQGDEKALAYVLKHNKIDVIECEKNYNKLVGFAKKNNTSI